VHLEVVSLYNRQSLGIIHKHWNLVLQLRFLLYSRGCWGLIYKSVFDLLVELVAVPVLLVELVELVAVPVLLVELVELVAVPVLLVELVELVAVPVLLVELVELVAVSVLHMRDD
jgi:hypothetical protein